MYFIEKLDRLIEEKGINRAKMLKDLHLAKNSFSNWSTRDTLPNGNTLVKIADYFNITIDELVGRKR